MSTKLSKGNLQLDNINLNSLQLAYLLDTVPENIRSSNKEVLNDNLKEKAENNANQTI